MISHVVSVYCFQIVGKLGSVSAVLFYFLPMTYGTCTATIFVNIYPAHKSKADCYKLLIILIV